MNPSNNTSEYPQEKPDLAFQGETLQSQNHATPPPKPKKAFKKWLLIALVIILILSLPIGGYLLLGKMGINPKPSVVTVTTPTPKPNSNLSTNSNLLPANLTANWKTYKGNGFSFKYPGHWDYNNREVYDPETINHGEYDIISYGEQLDFVLLPSLNYSIRDYIIDFMAAPKNIIMSDIYVNGLQGKTFSITVDNTDNDHRGGYAAFLKEDKLFLFHTTSHNITDNIVFNTIINTFKFDPSISPTNNITMTVTPEKAKIGETIKIKITGIKDTNYALEFTDSNNGWSDIVRLETKIYNWEKQVYEGTFTIPQTVSGFPSEPAQNSIDMPTSSGNGKITLIHDFEPEKIYISDTFTRLFSIPITVEK